MDAKEILQNQIDVLEAEVNELAKVIVDNVNYKGFKPALSDISQRCSSYYSMRWKHEEDHDIGFELTAGYIKQDGQISPLKICRERISTSSYHYYSIEANKIDSTIDKIIRSLERNLTCLQILKDPTEIEELANSIRERQIELIEPKIKAVRELEAAVIELESAEKKAKKAAEVADAKRFFEKNLGNTLKLQMYFFLNQSTCWREFYISAFDGGKLQVKESASEKRGRWLDSDKYVALYKSFQLTVVFKKYGSENGEMEYSKAVNGYFGEEAPVREPATHEDYIEFQNKSRY